MKKPRLFLHVCCGPCSTHPLNMLIENYEVTGFFYNPNIYPESEYQARLKEAKRYFEIKKRPLIVFETSHELWKEYVKKYVNEPEGGKRCELCFRYRLEETVKYAKKEGYDFFTTTLTIGPNKPAKVIFPIGQSLENEYGVKFLAIDFKKKDGFKISCKISKELGMYRQHYCGCEYSLR